MQVRTFVADTAPQAIAQVREELGPEAVIIALDQAARGRGVVVRAAIEDALATAETTQETAQEKAEAAEPTVYEQRLEQLLASRLRTPVPMRTSGPRFSVQELEAALAFHRLPKQMAESLAQAAAAFEGADIELSLARALDRHITLSPLPALPSRPVVVIGPAGSGKTSIAARLALRAKTSGAATVLATLDGGKAGARAQIETYAELIGAAAHAVDGIDGARALIEKNRGAQIFLDTAGLNVFNKDELAATQALVAAIDAEALAVIPAGLDAEEAAEVAALAKSAGATRFIATRTDAARRMGGLFTAAAKLSLSHLTNSPFLGNGVEAPHTLNLARLILNGAQG